MATDGELGVEKEVALPGARLRYRERGDGPPVVFVHGLLANADLWGRVVPGLAAAGTRCLAPDWPLGSHPVPVPDADLDPVGVADLVEAFLERLDLHGVTLVANDTGGVPVQLLMGRNPERVARVVLTPCDSFERFLPPLFAPLPVLARVPGGVTLMAQGLRLPALARSPLAYGALTRRGLPDAMLASFTAPVLDDPGVRADLGRFLRTVHRRHSLAAARGLEHFDRPVLLAWAVDDRVFPISLAHRLAARLPRAEIAAVSDAATFVPVDRPDELTRLVSAFVGLPAPH